MIDIVDFKNKLKNNKCPFCEQFLIFYDGILGYEALKCDKCKMFIDNNGLSFED